MYIHIDNIYIYILIKTNRRYETFKFNVKYMVNNSTSIHNYEIFIKIKVYIYNLYIAP